MSCYNTSAVIEIIMAILMVVSVVLIFIERYRKGSGLGARTIQTICIALIIPAIVILSIEKVLVGETVATIIGGLVGYVLSSVGNYESKPKTKTQNDDN